MRRFVLSGAIFFLISCTGPASAQQAVPPSTAAAAHERTLPALTTAQMYEDFDALVKIVRDVMPTIAANRAVYGIDVFANLARYRAQIPSLRSTADFVMLVDHAINSCKGSHFDAATITAASVKDDEDLRRFVEGFVSESALQRHEAYLPMLKQARQGRRALNIPLFYLAGDYYVKHDFTFEGKTYARGLKLVECNGMRPSEVLSKVSDYAPFPWDSGRRQFFFPSLLAYRGVPVPPDGRMALVFENAAGERMAGSFPSEEKVTFEAPPRTTAKYVAYLQQPGVLYVRVPMMVPDDIAFYKERIAQEGKRGPVRAAVIDIRGNGGGSDRVWMEILSALLDRAVSYKGRTGVRNTDIIRRYVARAGDGSYLKRARPQRVGFLDNEEFIVNEATATIKPAADSLKVPVIYVLTENVFSAAGSLTTVAGLTEPIVSLGVRNPYILGRGIDPLLFSLPNSGYTFRIEPVVDLTGATRAEHVFHSEVEVEVEASAEEMLAYYNEKQDRLEEFLVNYDPFFKRMLADLSKRQAAGRRR